MKAINSRQFPPLVVRTLKLVAIILILSSLVDYLFLLVPFAPLDRQWQLSFTTQIVDRGIIPMVGIALLFVGYWIDNSADTASANRGSWQDSRFWVLLLSSLLGLIFLLVVPLHLNNARLASNDALKQINQEATQAEGQIDSRLGEEVARQREQISALIQDDQRLNEAIRTGQIRGEQVTLLQKFKSDPKALDQFLDQQAKDTRSRIQTQVRSRKLEAERRAKTEALKSALRIGISSLLLAVGYITIGWTGLRDLNQTNRRKPPGA
jgi:ABC-type multidrug transport system fused ATPase/permease subunit